MPHMTIGKNAHATGKKAQYNNPKQDMNHRYWLLKVNIKTNEAAQFLSMEGTQ